MWKSTIDLGNDKGPFITYARWSAGKNKGWATSSSGQSGGGGRGVINKSAHKRGATWSFILVLFLNKYFQSSRNKTVHGLHISQYYVQRPSSLVLVPEEFPLLQWSTTRSSSQSRILTKLPDNTSCSFPEMFASISKLVWKKHERWFVGFYRSFYLAF